MKAKSNTEKTNLHPRNLDRFGYNFEQLINVSPDLQQFVAINEHNIDSSDSEQAKQTLKL